MKRLMSAVAACLGLFAASAGAQSVPTFHNAPDRSGLYLTPGLTGDAATHMHIAAGFHAAISGNVYAQPLYWQAPSAKTGIVIVATESNTVYALNANTGAQVWKTQLARPAPLNALECGDIDPEGITGTPVIDTATGTLYLDAAVLTAANTPRHMVYALSASNGKPLPGWPLNVEALMNARHAGFSSFDQGQRSALMFFKGRLYISYGGRAGDCGGYHGQVIEFNPANRSITGNWATRAIGGGIWSQGGVVSDGTDLFATTGNTFGANAYQDGEGIFRLRPGLARAKTAADFFAPKNWKTLDNFDADLGGTHALPITVPTASGTASRMLALGKDGIAYLVARANLGGVSNPLFKTQVSNSRIITAPAVYSGKNETLVVYHDYDGATPGCSGNNISALKVASGAAPISVLWCTPFNGAGSPIVTVTANNTNPIVWVAGAEGDNKLHGFSALNGKPLFESLTAMTGLRRFGTILVANRHLYIAGDNKLYAFTF